MSSDSNKEPQPCCRIDIPGVESRTVEEFRLLIPKQVLSADTQRLIWEEVGEKCVICFTVVPFSEGGRAMPLLNQREAKHAVDVTLVPSDFSIDSQDNGIWLCSHCIPMMITNGTMMPTSFFLPSTLLEYVIKFRREDPSNLHTPVYQIFRQLESQPSLNEAASALLGQYRLRQSGPEIAQDWCPELPSFITNQANDGPIHVYDTHNSNTLPSSADDGPRNQLWQLHRPPGVMFAFLNTHFSPLFYADKDDNYMPPEECLQSASLYRDLLQQLRGVLYHQQ